MSASTLRDHRSNLLSTPTRPKCTFFKKMGHLENKSFKKYPLLDPPSWDTGKPTAHVHTSTSSTSDTKNATKDDEFVCLLSNEQKLSPPDTWIIDSGCTSHMTYSRSSFFDYIEDHMGTDAKETIEGVGYVLRTIRINNKITKIKLTNDLHVPEFLCQLLSVTKMTSLGVRVSFNNSRCNLHQKGKPVGSGTRQGHYIILKHTLATHISPVTRKPRMPPDYKLGTNASLMSALKLSKP